MLKDNVIFRKNKINRMQNPENSQNILKPILMNKYSHKGFFMKIFFIPPHSSFLMIRLKLQSLQWKELAETFKNMIFRFFFFFTCHYRLYSLNKVSKIFLIIIILV